MRLRKLAAATVAPLIATAALVGTTLAPAQAATEIDHTTGWLASQLDGNLYHGEYGPSYGSSLDAALALGVLGETGLADDILDTVAADWEAYTTGEAFGDAGSIYAGSTGKLAALLSVSGADASNSHGANHIERLEDRISEDGPDAGRATDASSWGDYSNGIGQSWVVRALALADSDKTQVAADFLVGSQCDDGLFPTYFDDPCAGGIDTTAYAILALDDAINAGLTGLDDDFDEAIAGLIAAQNADGSFGADGTVNANSTGLAAYVLRRAGEDAAADAATDWLRTVYVTPQVGADTALGDEVGAIAYSAARFAAGQDEGIADAATRDQWFIATSQAALGFAGNSTDLPDAELPPVEPEISHPTSVEAGGEFEVTGSGFGAEALVTIDLTVGDAPAGAASSLFRIEIVATVTADASGNIARTLTAPTAADVYTLTVTDGQNTATSTLTVTAAGPGGDAGGDADAGAGTGTGATGATAASDATMPQTGAAAQPWWILAAALLVAVGAAVVGFGRRFARVGA